VCENLMERSPGESGAPILEDLYSYLREAKKAVQALIAAMSAAIPTTSFCSKTPTHSRRRSFVVAQHSTEASTTTDGLGL
jgi:hypothetical protein